MIDKFLDAYRAWPSSDQREFAVVALLIVAAVVFCGSYGTYILLKELMFYVSVWFRGWPEYQEHVGGLLPKPPTRPDEPRQHPLATFRPANIFGAVIARIIQPVSAPTVETPPQLEKPVANGKV